MMPLKRHEMINHFVFVPKTDNLKIKDL